MKKRYIYQKPTRNRTFISGAARIGEAIRKTKKMEVKAEELIMMTVTVTRKGWGSTDTAERFYP